MNTLTKCVCCLLLGGFRTTSSSFVGSDVPQMGLTCRTYPWEHVGAPGQPCSSSSGPAGTGTGRKLSGGFRGRQSARGASCVSSSPTHIRCALCICCAQTFYVTVDEFLPCFVYPVRISFLWQWYSI